MAVVIGKEYKNAFDSIRRLVEGGCAPEEVRLENGRIVHGREVFEYSDSAAGIDVRGGGANVSMEGGKGASWFASLRGDRRDNGLAKWKDLIETVSGYYHEHYSLTDRGAPLSGPDEETRRRTADALFSLVRLGATSAIFTGWACARSSAAARATRCPCSRNCISGGAKGRSCPYPAARRVR